MTKKKIRYGLAAMLAILVAWALVPTHALAATKTVKSTGFLNGDAAAILKRDAVVKKGTTKLTFSKTSGWVSFLAPATKTYTFTLSGLKSPSKQCQSVAVSTYLRETKSNPYVLNKKVATKGGKTDALYLAVNGTKFTAKVCPQVLSRPLATRTAKVKLKKGQRIFFFANCWQSAKFSAKLVVKAS